MSHEASSILDFIRPGDVLIVVKLGRLDRNTRDVRNLSTNWRKKEQASVLEPPSTPAGRWAAWS